MRGNYFSIYAWASVRQTLIIITICCGEGGVEQHQMPLALTDADAATALPRSVPPFRRHRRLFCHFGSRISAAAL